MGLIKKTNIKFHCTLLNRVKGLPSSGPASTRNAQRPGTLTLLELNSSFSSRTGIKKWCVEFIVP